MTDNKDDFRADIEAVSRIPIVANMLEVICRTTGMGFAAVARVTDDRWVVCSVRDEISFGLQPGSELKLETTICNEIRQHHHAVVIDHVAEDENFAHHHTPAMYGFQSYISMPITRKDGTFFGTLCSIDPRPAKLNNPTIIGMFNLFADLISFHLNAAEQLSFTEADFVNERRDAELQAMYTAELTLANQQLRAANQELAAAQIDLQKAISKVTESEDKLWQAIQTGKMGTWSIDPHTYELTMSDFIRDLLGFPLDGVVSPTDILEVVDPEFREPLSDVLRNAIENHQSTDIEYSVVNRLTGERKWVRATGKVFFDADGNANEYSGLFMDITERKLDDLRKNDFIGMVSHELKTPLTSLNAYVQMLQQRTAKTGDTFTAGALQKAHTQVKKMTVMINGFLNVSRLESGKIHLHKQEFLLNEVLKDVVDEVTLTLSSSHVITIAQLTPVTVYADIDKIGNVITNLLSNAVKYSPTGKQITVNCIIVDDAVQVSITDEGMGIKPQHLTKLFDRFYRVDAKHTQQISGFGIGLYLSAEIVKSHGGHIWVESETGVGSTFYFTLPLTAS